MTLLIKTISEPLLLQSNSYRNTDFIYVEYMTLKKKVTQS